MVVLDIPKTWVEERFYSFLSMAPALCLDRGFVHGTRSRYLAHA